MKLSILLAGCVLLFSFTTVAKQKLKEPLKWTELKLAACDVLIENYSINMDTCKKMNNFVIEKNYSDNVITGIGIELSNQNMNCHLYASRDTTSEINWKVEEDLRNRDQGCIEQP